MRVLVLDGNENQAVAAVRSLGTAGYDVIVGAPTRWSKAGWSRRARGTFRYTAPDTDPGAFLAGIVAETARSPGTLILPMTERTTLPLSEHRDAVYAVGGRLVLPDHAKVLHAFDKHRMTALARDLGIAVPGTVLLPPGTEPSAAELGLAFPLVLKGRTSEEVTASGALRPTGAPVYARDASELALAVQSLRQRSSEVLIQEYIPGTGGGYFALMRHGQLRAEFAHRRLRDIRPTGSGSALRESVRPDERMRAAAQALLTALGWHGVAMVEFRIRPDGTPVFLELNARFWNSLALPVYAGVDFPTLLARLASEGECPAVTSYREGVRCRWLLGDFRHLLAVWKGPPAGYPGKYPGKLATLARFLLPVPGTYHDNFQWVDPLPEAGDWLDVLIHRWPRRRSQS